MSNRKRHEPGSTGPGSHDAFLVAGPRQIGRREFVRSSSGLLVAVSMFGCSDPSAPNSGVVRVMINGLGGGLATAGSATITGEGIAPINLVLPAIAEGSASVKAGNYHVVYAPPPGYTMAPGQLNEIDVVVVAGETTDVQFNVVPATGTLRVTVTGLAGGLGSGGSAQALRTDIGGQAPLAIVIPGTGTVDSSVAPGTYSVTYTAPAGYQLTGGATNPVVVVVASSATATASFPVEVSGVPTAVVFQSDWAAAALGSSTASKNDGGKWPIVGGSNGTGVEVVSATGLGMPATMLKCLRVPWNNGVFNFLRVDTLPVPALGQSRAYRLYQRIVLPDGTADINTHPNQDGNAIGGCNWAWNVFNDAPAGKWRPGVQFVGDTFPNNNFIGPNLDKGVTYRLEFLLTRDAVSATAFKFDLRISTAAGAPVANGGDFVNASAISLTAYCASNNLVFNNPANLNGFNAGANDVGPEAGDWGYQGGIAIRDNEGFIGGYGSVVGEP
ncbi:MAG: hypothetical protein KF709_05815 [Gemmatimonadaceae bacterium]|nr:hypothetical protein [Gemmatimonadaceae bacterium]